MSSLTSVTWFTSCCPASQYTSASRSTLIVIGYVALKLVKVEFLGGKVSAMDAFLICTELGLRQRIKQSVPFVFWQLADVLDDANCTVTLLG